jgi:hypothetical protein
MSTPPAFGLRRLVRWLICAALAVLVVVELRAGVSSRLASSVLLLLGFVLTAAVAVPRPPAVEWTIRVSFIAAFALILARVFGLIA